MRSKDQILLESLYLKIIEEQEESFSDKWNNALQNSEELKVAVDLMKNIKAVFPQGEIYIVGGVPRDLLLGSNIDDVDLATNIPFDKLETKFELRNISKNNTQPVYDIEWNGYHYDIAKFRTDSGDVGRQNNISTETDSFSKDTERRDLTINSFGIDENGTIVDHQNGLQDLKDKIVRAVGDPKKRFMEDATRILRVFRFAAKMGFEIEQETKNAAIELKEILSNPDLISLESISREFYKSAKSGKTLMRFLQMLQETKILHDILPEFTSMEGFTHNPKHHPEGGSTVLGHIYECLSVSPYKDPVINLAILFHDFGKATTRGEKEGQSTYHGHESAGVPIVENIFKRLKFTDITAEDKKNILQAVDKHMLVHNLDQLNIKTLSKLILDPSWYVVKAVAYCDEASRGSALFDEQEFQNKIKRAEEKVANIGSDSEDLRKKIKKYIDGEKLMTWYPELKTQRPKLGKLLKKTQDHVLEIMNSNQEPSEDEIKNYVDSIFNESVTFKDFFTFKKVLTEGRKKRLLPMFQYLVDEFANLEGGFPYQYDEDHTWTEAPYDETKSKEENAQAIKEWNKEVLENLFERMIKKVSEGIGKENLVVMVLRALRNSLDRSFYDMKRYGIVSEGERDEDGDEVTSSREEFEDLIHRYPRNFIEKVQHFRSLNSPEIQKMLKEANPKEDWFELESKLKDLEKEWIGRANNWIDVTNDIKKGNIKEFINFGKMGWFTLMAPYCEKEGKAMGHCGNRGSFAYTDTVLSLRETKKEKNGIMLAKPYLTFILKAGEYLGEMKGRGNQKPQERYHSYIIDLLTYKENGKYLIKDIEGGGYLPQNNFDIQDLSFENLVKLTDERPDLMAKRLEAYSREWTWADYDTGRRTQKEPPEQMIKAIMASKNKDKVLLYFPKDQREKIFSLTA